MNAPRVSSKSSLSIAMSANAAPQFRQDARGLARAGNIELTVLNGTSATFTWKDAIVHGLMVDGSLSGGGDACWEVHSIVGMSSVVVYGCLPQFAEEIVEPLRLIPGRRYFVSVYGTYPHYGIQEFVL